MFVINYQYRTIVMGNYILNTVDHITSLQVLHNITDASPPGTKELKKAQAQKQAHTQVARSVGLPAAEAAGHAFARCSAHDFHRGFFPISLGASLADMLQWSSDVPLSQICYNGQVTCPSRSESADLRVSFSCVCCLGIAVGLFVYRVCGGVSVFEQILRS